MVTFNRTKLKEEITRKGFNARTLAQESGIAESTIGRILRGERSPQPGTLDKIAQALNCNKETFFSFEAPGMTFFERLIQWKGEKAIADYLASADDETHKVFWMNYLCDVFENGATEEAYNGSIKLIKEKGAEHFNREMKMLLEVKTNYELYMRLDENGEIYIYLPDKEYDHMLDTLTGKQAANNN